MSSIDKDRHRRISEPTEADFIRGFAADSNKGRAQSIIVTALWALGLIGKAK